MLRPAVEVRCSPLSKSLGMNILMKYSAGASLSGPRAVSNQPPVVSGLYSMYGVAVGANGLNVCSIRVWSIYVLPLSSAVHLDFRYSSPSCFSHEVRQKARAKCNAVLYFHCSLCLKVMSGDNQNSVSEKR